METLKKHRCFEGELGFYKHDSKVNNAPMTFAVYMPPQAKKKRVPVLYYLSGLTCTEENFMAKAGAQQYAAKHGIALVSMDTSPRDLGFPGEDDSYDFGSGAGFYVNATEQPWAKHYQMYDYVVDELPAFIQQHFRVDSDRMGIFGHSMGGHGALIIALKNPGKYRSVSAFSPIVAPMHNDWGKKAFSGYLGSNEETWKQYDTCELIKQTNSNIPLFVDQGMSDEFLTDYLQPERLQAVCQEQNHPLTMRKHDGYDHSYYFISTFMEDHIDYHADLLLA
ncbi:S-formylglutathione hydrolase [Marinicella gelatinilytica]|uniref:S-formylglutathione hydrolase n=1 Tax=Marinicella gelatinilytica TaxID=2996017 RepID=UPI002260F036|nr:S-formylglutathione hydrolase [Marinicella gelatinilytica]MCX7545784.1 S-formylglutathione hydrolase [Marinicella gelatinilytica]